MCLRRGSRKNEARGQLLSWFQLEASGRGLYKNEKNFYLWIECFLAVLYLKK